MKLKKEFVVVSHCILNQHAVIPGRERARGAFPLAISLLNQGVALLQLPCPEFLTLGKERPPMTYQEYVAIPGYRQKCQRVNCCRYPLNCLRSAFSGHSAQPPSFYYFAFHENSCNN